MGRGDAWYFKRASVLRVGIASYEEIKKRTLAIASGKYEPVGSDSRIWFSSIKSLAKVGGQMMLCSSLKGNGIKKSLKG